MSIDLERLLREHDGDADAVVRILVEREGFSERQARELVAVELADGRSATRI